MKLEALPETEIYISAFYGEIVRQSATVLNDAVAVPYDLQRIDVVPDEVNYNGCDRTTTTIEAEVYLRPDSTILIRAIR